MPQHRYAEIHEVSPPDAQLQKAETQSGYLEVSDHFLVLRHEVSYQNSYEELSYQISCETIDILSGLLKFNSMALFQKLFIFA